MITKYTLAVCQIHVPDIRQPQHTNVNIVIMAVAFNLQLLDVAFQETFVLIVWFDPFQKSQAVLSCTIDSHFPCPYNWDLDAGKADTFQTEMEPHKVPLDSEWRCTVGWIRGEKFYVNIQDRTIKLVMNLSIQIYSGRHGFPAPDEFITEWLTHIQRASLFQSMTGETRLFREIYSASQKSQQSAKSGYT